MFIRVNNTPNSPRKSIQICETYRKDGKVKQRIVHYVGVALDDAEEEKLKAYAHELIAKITVEREKKSPQLSLLPLTEPEVFDAKQRKPGRPVTKKLEDILPPSQVSLDDIIEESRIIEGVHDISGPMFDEIYGQLLSSPRQIKLLKDVVLARLVYPSSKHRTAARLDKEFGKTHSVDSIYRMMDVLFENLDKMKQLTFNKTQSLFPEKIDLLLFDVTTLYFESTDVDDLRKFGYSKDHRFNTTQIVLALATNQDGLPIGYELFEGNKAEVKTLITAIQNWKKLFSIQSVCFVGDRAMFGEDNLRLLEKKGYHYIIAAKLKSLSSSLKNQILNEQHYLPQAIGDDFGWISEFAYSPFSCSLLQLQTIPKTEDIKHLLQDHLYAYAWCDQDFYALNLVEASCTLLALSDTKRQELQGSLKIFKEKEKKHYLVRAASLPTSLDQLTLPENNYNFYIHIANDHTQLLYANRSAGTLTSLPVALADQESLDIIMSNLPTDKALTAMQLRVITTLTGHQREKSINLSLHLSEKNLDDIKLLTGHSFAVHRRLIVSYKSKRAFKDQSDRQHILNKIKRVIGENGNPSKLITNAGVKQFVTKDEKANVQLDETKVKESAEWDGLHGIITNIQQESSASLLLRYSKLWIIEESFRINKHTLKMRPIFHWKPERIHAHIGICYMTFSILRHLQYQINLIKKVSIDTILDELLGVQASIYIHKKTKDRYRIPGYFSNNARKIYKAFSLERPLDATIYLP